MNFYCDKKYMVLPASFFAKEKRLCFYEGDNLIFDVVVPLDNDQPDCRFPVDIERFKGKTLRVECDKDVDFSIETTDAPELDYSGKYRPLAHFTSMRGWLNDPNGLVFANGKYLMYYQHNPAATVWGNMHWGSAESTDLIHWKENGDVMFPDENGMVYSGCAIVDKRNVSGLKQGENDVILFFYSCAGGSTLPSQGKPFTQNLAYSTDGGKTLIRCEKPILDEIVFANRDPKVIYYEPDDCYIMVLYLEKHDFAFFRSKNLLDWEEIQRFTFSEYSECPDFYPLPVEGENAVKWVFSAAADGYCIGSFDGKKFVPESGALRLNYGNASYAAQSWSDVPDGRRVRTAFAVSMIPGMPFGSCMDIPQEMSLRKVNGELKLCANPVEEIRSLYLATVREENVRIDKENPLKRKIGSKACDVSLEISGSFTVSLYGMEISYDSCEKLLKCGDKSAPVTEKEGAVSLRIIFDTIFTEIFAEEGSVFMGMTYQVDAMLHTLCISAENAVVKTLSVSELDKFYK